jgi:hypothetical protein
MTAISEDCQEPVIILDVIWGCARYAVGIALRGEVAKEFLGSSAACGSYRHRSLSAGTKDRRSRVFRDIWACLDGSSDSSMSRSGQGMIVRFRDLLLPVPERDHGIGND